MTSHLHPRTLSGPAGPEASLPTDVSLLDAVARGDRSAFEALYLRYHPRLLGFLSRWISSRERAEEVLQEVMFVVWTRAADFGGRSRPSTWIFGIAYRQAMHSLDRGRDAALDSADGELADRGVEDRAMGNRELRLSLEKALDRLSSEHRAVLELTFFEDCSYREIAEILGCPLNTVKTRMFHAREHMRRILPRLGWGAR